MSSYPNSFKIQCLGCSSSCANIRCSCHCPKCQAKNISITSYCRTPQSTMNVIQDNSVSDFHNSHVWSNSRGYGNIVIGTADSDNLIYGRVSPWNRIPKLSLPTSTNVETSASWSSKEW
jgi:hypothetical protein